MYLATFHNYTHTHTHTHTNTTDYTGAIILTGKIEAEVEDQALDPLDGFWTSAPL